MNAKTVLPLTGWPVVTLSRGEVGWDGAEETGASGLGRFLRCDKPAPPKPYGGALDNA